MSARQWRWRQWGWPPRLAALSALVVVADQLSKYWAVGALTDAFTSGGGAPRLGGRLGRFLWQRHPRPAGMVEVIAGRWRHRYVENPGAAWGFLSQVEGDWRTPFFLLVSLVSMVVVWTMVHRSAPREVLLRLGLALVFGGAVGNFIDRARLGYVIDFIDWHLGDGFAWPTFNVADAAISSGVALLLLDSIRASKTPAQQRPQG